MEGWSTNFVVACEFVVIDGTEREGMSAVKKDGANTITVVMSAVVVIIALANVLDVHAMDTDTQEYSQEVINSDVQGLLMHAIEENNVSEVKKIIEQKADTNKEYDDGITPLIRASSEGHVIIAGFLIARKADINTQHRGRTPLLVACSGGDREMARMLLNVKADIEAVNDEGFTPLMAASGQGSIALVSMLLNAKAKVDTQGDRGLTSLVIAACMGHADVVRTLLKKANVAVSEQGKRALVLAEQKEHSEIVKLLQEHMTQKDT